VSALDLETGGSSCLVSNLLKEARELRITLVRSDVRQVVHSDATSDLLSLIGLLLVGDGELLQDSGGAVSVEGGRLDDVSVLGEAPCEVPVERVVERLVLQRQWALTGRRLGMGRCHQDAVRNPSPLQTKPLLLALLLVVAQLLLGLLLRLLLVEYWS
jgi:hypothetical protein